ncbi:MAG: hypothetical protein LBS01_10575, partial [Prevotellaceae bacterium]|nr:hypothetical protein [Prevotellaceae bacterium]
RDNLCVPCVILCVLCGKKYLTARDAKVSQSAQRVFETAPTANTRNYHIIAINFVILQVSF